MNFGEIKDRVNQILAENASNPAYWSEEDIEDSVNEGYWEMCDASECHERYVTLQQFALMTYYDLRGVLGETVLVPLRVYTPMTKRWMVFRGVRDLDEGRCAYYAQWESVGGEAREVFMRSLFYLGVYPRSSGDVDKRDSFRVHFRGLPPKMRKASDTPVFPEDFHQGIVEYAAYDLLCQDQEVIVGLDHWEEYGGYEAGLVKFVEDRQQIDRRHQLMQEGPVY